jgi:hypothetical protein
LFPRFAPTAGIDELLCSGADNEIGRDEARSLLRRAIDQVRDRRRGGVELLHEQLSVTALDGCGDGTVACGEKGE